MPLSPEDIERQVFKERIRGYDMEEVDAFLDRVVQRMRELVEERNRLARQLEEAGDGGAGEEAELLRRTLVTAQRAADQTLADARAEAERMVAEAQDEAARERERLREETGELVRAVEDLGRFRRDYAERVRTVIEDHLRVLDERSVPEVPEEVDEIARQVAASMDGAYHSSDAMARSALDTVDEMPADADPEGTGDY